MRSLAAVIVVAALCCWPSLSRAGASDADEQKILFVRDKVWRAWFADDEATLRLLVPSDAVVISAGEKNWKTQTDVLRDAREFHKSGGKLIRLTFPRTAIQRFHEAAFVYSDYVLELGQKGKSTTTRGRATEVFVLRGGQWINPGWHTDSQ